MPTPRLSIVIPTHKRPEILRETLRHLEAQTIRDELEVIVVSDGPSEIRDMRVEIKNTFLEVAKSHQGVARNRGVQEAKGERVLFIGDDIFLAPDVCEKHMKACHGSTSLTRTRTGSDVSSRAKSRDDMAVLGHTTWDPAVGITPVMEWLEQSGWQFGYPAIKPYSHQAIPQNIQHRFTYTSHISLPTEVAKKFPFREDVTLYGWEDIEWGLRLAKAGIPLFYEPDAKALHHHHLELEDSLRRMETLGKSAVEIEKISPELNVVPKGLERVAYQLAAVLPTMSGQHRKAFLAGITNDQAPMTKNDKSLNH